MQKNIIADTSCLVLLEKINELDILQKLFQAIYITATIAKEFDSNLPEWVHKEELKDKKYQQIRLMEPSVDPGEARAIALAVEIN